MIDPTIFYKTYNDDYHKFKVDTILSILDDLPKYEREFFGEELDEESREAYKNTLQSDLRQTYFHAVETFFQIMFALDPTEKNIFDEDNILFKITNSGFDNYKRIEDVATNPNSLSFLDRKISFHEFSITGAHYIFYYGIFPGGKFEEKHFMEIEKSLQAIKYGIEIIAKDFVKVKREEYNCYKHGLKIMPLMKEFVLADAKNKEILLKFDLSNSMTYFERKQKGKDELKMITKVFDSKKDACMTKFCSNMITHMVFYRKVVKFNKSIKHREIPIFFFSRESIDECNENNATVQDFIWTIKKIK